MQLQLLDATSDHALREAAIAPLVLRSFCLLTRAFEAAGRAFFDRHERCPEQASHESVKRNRKLKVARQSSDGEADVTTGPKFKSPAEWRKWAAKTRKQVQAGGTHGRLRKLVDEGVKLYEVLGVCEGASLDEIRKSYRKLVLKHHPDKAGTASAPTPSPPRTTSSSESPQSELGGTAGQEGESTFLLIQDAYEILMDAEAKRQYDSSLPFDDSIPTPAEVEHLSVNTPAEFFELFRPVFERNARWSIHQPCPPLGDDETSYNKVKKTYDFWFKFMTWRDFSIECDEHDPDDAECREERRWMERENQKLRKEKVAEENERIRKLVNLAYSKDPRILRYEQEQKRLRLEKRQAARRGAQAEEERRRREKYERACMTQEDGVGQKRRSDEEAAAKKRNREQLKSCKRRFRQLVASHTNTPGEYVQEFCADENVTSSILQEACEAIEKRLADRSDQSDVESYLAEFFAVHEAKWREIKEQNERTLQVDAQKRREARLNAESKARAAAAEQWTKEELETLTRGIQRFPGGTIGRWEKLSALIKTKTADQVLAKTKEIGSTRSVTATSPPQADTPEAPTTAKPRGLESTEGTKAGVGIMDVEGADKWTPQQQTALEKALAKHPSTLPAKERWNLIAKDVEGKNAKQCLARFKEIRKAVLSSRK